jgi:hypothetical protein
MRGDRRALLRLEVPLGALGASLVALAALFAALGIPAWIPPAVMVRLGMPSPLTGMTRSFVALASGDVSAAFSRHPLGPILFAACATLPVVALASWLRGRRFEALARLIRSRALWLGFAVAFGLVWVRQIVTG